MIFSARAPMPSGPFHSPSQGRPAVSTKTISGCISSPITSTSWFAIASVKRFTTSNSVCPIVRSSSPLVRRSLSLLDHGADLAELLDRADRIGLDDQPGDVRDQMAVGSGLDERLDLRRDVLRSPVEEGLADHLRRDLIGDLQD